jgi:hypothetical protein
MSNECEKKKVYGRMEYWFEKKVFSLLSIIPTFHYSGIILIKF